MWHEYNELLFQKRILFKKVTKPSTRVLRALRLLLVCRRIQNYALIAEPEHEQIQRAYCLGIL